jgi:predicted ATPase
VQAPVPEPPAVALAAPVAVAVAGAAGNLPPGLPQLVGRETALRDIDALFGSGRLVTVCGTAGVGKTSLALAAASRRRALYAGGAWLAELAPLPAESTRADDLRALLGRLLQLPQGGARDEAALAQSLRGQAVLLLLDNAEHLLDALAPLVARLHLLLPQLHWLVTSREPLRIAGEQVLRLAPLDLPAAGGDDGGDEAAASGAMQLFVQRVAARLPGFAPGGDQRRALAQVCRALDGLPLALELAAARVPVLGVHGLAQHLADGQGRGTRLQLLTHADRTAAPHQRTLRAALDWSHALLQPAEQVVFRRLAVFRGGFTLAAAQSVCADAEFGAWQVLDALDALTGKSLLNAVPQDDGPARFTLLESLREYAAAQLQAAGEEALAQRRHLRAVLEHWAQADMLVLSQPVLQWSARQTLELENLRSALRWATAWLARHEGSADGGTGGGMADLGADLAIAGDTPDAIASDLLALVARSANIWGRLGLLAEGGPWCLGVRSRAERHPDPALRAGIDLALANICRYLPLLPHTEALPMAERAAAFYSASGDTMRAYFAHHLAWALALEIGEHIDRGKHLAAMRALVQPDWNPLLLRWWRLPHAQDERLQGRQESFLRMHREDLQTFEQMGALGEAWATGTGLMWAEHDQGRLDEAVALGRRLVDAIRAAGRLRTYTQLLTIYTTMLAETGDTAAARSALAEALPHLHATAACEILHLAMAWLAWHEGRCGTASLLLGWFDAPQRGGGVYGPRSYTRRTAAELGALLQSRVGDERHRQGLAAGATLGDAEAVRLGMASTDADPQTDENPTPS